ncbi:MAG: hypothetical protein L0Y38_00440 [Methylococcaceae bacterium]|nr:hypothetical protein [Methylococcaceae bacterium]MCI0732274.1 hypothetical protein [Methylococcaceae bacterium]
MSLERQAQTASEISEIFGKSASRETNRVKQNSASPFSLRLSADERARLNEQAGSQPLGAYIRSCLFGQDTKKRRPVRRPGLDHQKLALVLSELGRSRLASNMNQLAKAANIGTLDFSESVVGELQEACRAIAQMREMLIAALGLKPEGGA